MAAIQESVHIIPLGHEYDRAVKPFEKRKADRVYILSVGRNQNYSKEMIDLQEHFTQNVSTYLEAKNIDVKRVDVDLFDILAVLHHISVIILTEKNLGNNVHVNMSACGRLTSVGATLAGMAHGVKVYYVGADEYSLDCDNFMDHGLSICDRDSINQFENFKFVMPDPVGVKVLVELCRRSKGMNTKDLRSFLRNENIQGFEIDTDSVSIKHLKYGDKRLESTKQLMKLEKRYLQPLEREGYIKRERSGRNNIISITDAGKYIANISGLPI